MNRKRWPLPKIVDLGYHSVHIELVTKKQMAEESEFDPDGDHELAMGLWDGDHEIIYIGKWLTKAQQRWVLLHEMGHACLDLRDYYN